MSGMTKWARTNTDPTQFVADRAATDHVDVGRRQAIRSLVGFGVFMLFMMALDGRRIAIAGIRGTGAGGAPADSHRDQHTEETMNRYGLFNDTRQTESDASFFAIQVAVSSYPGDPSARSWMRSFLGISRSATRLSRACLPRKGPGFSRVPFRLSNTVSGTTRWFPVLRSRSSLHGWTIYRASPALLRKPAMSRRSSPTTHPTSSPRSRPFVPSFALKLARVLSRAPERRAILRAEDHRCDTEAIRQHHPRSPAALHQCVVYDDADRPGRFLFRESASVRRLELPASRLLTGPGFEAWTRVGNLTAGPRVMYPCCRCTR